jgi:hypothetical protein
MFFGTMAIATLIPGVVITQSANATMKAIVVHEYGGPEVLKYEELPRSRSDRDCIYRQSGPAKGTRSGHGD